jgi:hypothetical protein
MFIKFNKLNMKKNFTLFALLTFFSANTSYGLAGLYNSSVTVNGVELWTSTGTAFQGYNFGTVSSIVISTATNYNYSDGSGNICSGTLNYRIYPIFDAGNAGLYPNTTISMGYVSGSASGNNFQWRESSATGNLLTGKPYGAYKLEVFFQSTGSNNTNWQCSDNFWQTGTGLNYVADLYYPNPLDVTLQGFSVKSEDKYNVLNWKTAAEKNNNYFDIQRSVNGQDWAEIGQVKGSGTTNIAQSYTIVDKNPISGINYYRLKQVDYDGSFSFSAIVSVVNKGDKRELGIYPNPARDKIYLKNIETDDKVLVVYDVLGRKLLEINNNNLEIDVSVLPIGWYALKLIGQSGEVVGQSLFLKN